MSADVLQSISKNFSELEQEFDIESVPNKINDFKLNLDVGPSSKDVKQVHK
jgi:hypothetical protein